MTNKQILFTKINTAEFCEVEYKTPLENEVVVKTMFSTISAGTEKANLIDSPNLSGDGTKRGWPRALGYSSSGVVVEIGEKVTDVSIGDRVVVFWGCHKKYNTIPHDLVVKIPDDSISFEEAAVSFIATFPLAAIRKTRFEIGESAVVMGQGILGQLAIKLLRAAGAYPIIAVDPVESRRAEAVKNGADYAFDPNQDGFDSEIKMITNGGCKVAIEVTGIGAGLNGALDCMAKFGRVSLLGCTRDKNFTVDYYNKVHVPGLTIVGAHTLARPEGESYPGHFTHKDDIISVLNLCGGKRINIKDMIKETHNPNECFEVYKRLINDKDFPILVQFDWRCVE